MDLGSRVSLVVKPESVGTIDEYEFPNKMGRVFVRLDAGPGYWLHQFAILEEATTDAKTDRHFPHSV